MNQQQKMLEEMRMEDRRYGETPKNRKMLVKSKTTKNPKNLARYNMEELKAMEEDGIDDF